jgi:tetratricopeptide (TPR) repeat protein
MLVAVASSLIAQDPPTRLTEGVELAETGEFDQAVAFFEAVSPGSDSAWVDYYVGWIRLQQGDTDSAIESLLEATEADAHSALFERRLGDAYVQKIDKVGMLKKMGYAKKARASYEKAVELAPGDIDARQSLAEYFLNAPAIAGGSRAKAEEQVAEMKQLDLGKGHQLMGRVYISEEEWDQAVLELQAAIEAGENDSDSHYLMGFSLQQAEKYREALAAFERAIEVDPNSLDSYYQIGRTAIFSKSHLDRAVECLTFYLEQPPRWDSPGPEHAHWRLGMVYELQGQDEFAATEYRKALKLDPEHKEAKKALAGLG